MLICNYNLQSKILVKGLRSPTEFRLPAFYAGEQVDMWIRALQPTGDPDSPFEVVPATSITSAVLALTPVYDGAQASIVTFPGFPDQDDHLVGLLPIAADDVVPTGLQWVEARLSADLTISGGVTHIESPCIIRRPAFAITPPLTYENFLGPQGEQGPTGPAAALPASGQDTLVAADVDGALGRATGNQVLAAINAATGGRLLLTPMTLDEVAASGYPEGGVAYVTNGTGNKRLVTCDGNDWYYLDGTLI